MSTNDWEKGNRPYLKEISKLSFENMRWNRKNILAMRDFLSPWSHNIKLPHGIYTASCDDYYPAHKEIMKVVSQQLKGVFENKRVIDIGCLEGYFSAECALQGATVVGIDGKMINIKKCELIKSVLDIGNLTFIRDDAMRVTRKKYGCFDAVLALGLLYHFADPFRFLKNMFKLCNGLILNDTHVALEKQPQFINGSWKPDLSSMRKFRFANKTYMGRLFREFDPKTSQLSKDLSPRASLRNELSVWLTEDSLISMLRDVGFEQISKIVFPKKEKAWWSDVQKDARVLVLAVKKREPLKSRIFTNR